MARVLIPLADGFEDIEAVTVIDVLRRGGVGVVTASISDSLKVKSAHGVFMSADALLKDIADDELSAIILPGGGEGTQNLMNCHLLFDVLRDFNERGRLLCAICAAPTVLTAAGVVAEGLHVTCYPTCQMELDREWSPVPVVVEGNVITGQAPGTALLFALVILKTLTNEQTARKVARMMVTDVLG